MTRTPITVRHSGRHRLSRPIKRIAIGAVISFVLLVSHGLYTDEDDGRIWQEAADGDTAEIEMLNKAGRDINHAQNDLRITPLMIATLKGSTTTVNVLLDHHADVSYRRAHDGEIALRIATDDSREYMARMLKEARAKKAGNRGASIVTAKAPHGHPIRGFWSRQHALAVYQSPFNNIEKGIDRYGDIHATIYRLRPMSPPLRLRTTLCGLLFRGDG